jgi:hypothetical protein
MSLWMSVWRSPARIAIVAVLGVVVGAVVDIGPAEVGQRGADDAAAQARNLRHRARAEAERATAPASRAFIKIVSRWWNGAAFNAVPLMQYTLWMIIVKHLDNGDMTKILAAAPYFQDGVATLAHLDTLYAHLRAAHATAWPLRVDRQLVQ